MKLKLLSILTLFSVSSFAQNFNDAGNAPDNFDSNVIQDKTIYIPKKLSACDSSVFFDDFETNNTSKWNIISGSPSTTTSSPAEGIYCLENSGTSSHYQTLEGTFTPSTPTQVSYYVRTSDLAVHSGYFVIGDANVTTNNGIMFIYFQANSGLRFVGGLSQSHTITGVLANQWYHVELKNLDFNAKTMDIYVDNVLIQSNFPFRSQSSTDVSIVHLYNLTGSSTVHYDLVEIGEDNNPKLNFVSTNILCNGDTTGAIDLTPSGGTSPYTFDWNTTDTTEDLSNLAAGNYVITLTDDSGCVATDSVTITEPTAIAVTTDSLGSFLCNGDSTGAIFTTSSGGTPGYSYLWNTNDTIDDLTGLVAGTYILSVTDSNSCVHVETINLTQPDTISGNATVVPESISGNDGSIDQSTAGGTPGYTYNWSTTDTTEDISGLAVGTYTVTITDANGCTKVIEYNVPSNVGINQVEVEKAVSIFPNPTSGFVNIALASPITIEIFNAIGQQVMLVNDNKSKITLNVSSLAKGVYYLKAGEQTKRLIIK